MKQESPAIRRDFLRRMGFGLAGLFAGSAATAAGSQSRLFAGLFLKEKQSTRVPAGYYDPASKLFHNAETRKPMFVAEAEEPIRQLSTEELLQLIQSGRFIDVSKNPLYGVQPLGEWSATLSAQTTLLTTRCCPIVTDTSRDVGPDDTPPR